MVALKAKAAQQGSRSLRTASSENNASHQYSGKKKTGRCIRIQAWLNRECVTELQSIKTVYERWNLGQTTKEKCTNVAWTCRDDVRKAKAPLNLAFLRDVKATRRCTAIVL